MHDESLVTHDPQAIVQPRRAKWFLETGDGEHTVFVAKSVLGLTKLLAFDQSGQLASNTRRFDIDELRWEAVERLSIAPITLDTGRGELTLSVGAGVLFGKPDSGKTLFATTLNNLNENVKVLRYREPEADSMLYEADLVFALRDAMAIPGTVIIVDSIRTVFYDTGSGATGKGGVNMGIFPLLTAYDILARQAGCVVLFALNPMTTDDDAIEFYLEAARGSVAHTIHATAPLSVRVSSRTKGDRAWLTRAYKPDAKPVVQSSTSSIGIQPKPFRDDSIADLYIANP